MLVFHDRIAALEGPSNGVINNNKGGGAGQQQQQQQKGSSAVTSNLGKRQGTKSSLTSLFENRPVDGTETKKRRPV